MIDITTLTPIIVSTGLSFCFKNSRGIGIIGVAVMSYFYPGLFLILTSDVELGYLHWRHQQKKK